MSASGSRRKRPDAFSALVSALAAIEQNEPEQLAAALNSVPAEALSACAARHRCTGALLRGIDSLGVAGAMDRILVRGFQDRCKRAALAAYGYREQLALLVDTLRKASVPFALLKGAARLYAGEQGADWDELFDFDVLVRPADAEAAFWALVEAGYGPSQTEDAMAQEWYRFGHHHLLPLVPASGGLPVELHTALAPPGLMSQRFEWANLSAHFQTVLGTSGPVLKLDRAGSAIHLMIHGLGLTRLRDAALMARIIRDDPALLATLLDIARSDRLVPAGLEAVALVAAHIAGLSFNCRSAAARCVQYVARREAMPKALRARLWVADAWFGAGGRITSTILHATVAPYKRTRLIDKITQPLAMAGRVVLGGFAVAYALLAPGALDLRPATAGKH